MLKTETGKTRMANLIMAVLMVCVFALQCTPFWDYGSGTSSINGYIWLNTGNAELGNWLTRNLGTATDVNSILGFPILISILAIAGIILCVMKSSVSLVSLIPGACGLLGIIGYLVKPAFRLGSNWIVHMIVFALLVAISVISIVKSHQASAKESVASKGASKDDIAAKVSMIKGLSMDNPKSVDANEKNFNKLLNFLTDESPECRIASCQMLGETTKDIAITHITHLLDKEEDEDVIKAMRAALSSIKANRAKLHMKQG